MFWEEISFLYRFISPGNFLVSLKSYSNVKTTSLERAHLSESPRDSRLRSARSYLLSDMILTPHCTKLYLLHCTILDCTVLYCTVLHCSVLHCTAHHQISLHCKGSHYKLQQYATVWHCYILHSSALHSSARPETGPFGDMKYLLTAVISDPKWK